MTDLTTYVTTTITTITTKIMPVIHGVFPVQDHPTNSLKGPELSSLCPVSLSTPAISLFHLIETHRINDITAQFIPLINSTMRETVLSHVI
ncbi:hypothetical protein E2C01_049303 [Portunus trituberculatus]|uniref:Uncharacterized protein n=1 Tax=Portunus trituberculatus TaxID=210409 RepID=A0A5B7G586_PORTR|nr:hypothetical protein [Portunus trituberculatus]